jgi:phage terminase Nu1 subunit (DNA packaging protein)
MQLCTEKKALNEARVAEERQSQAELKNAKKRFDTISRKRFIRFPLLKLQNKLMHKCFNDLQTSICKQ